MIKTQILWWKTKNQVWKKYINALINIFMNFPQWPIMKYPSKTSERNFIGIILSDEHTLKSFGNWHTRFVILGITFRFTYGELDLYHNKVKFQNIMTRLSENFLVTRYTYNNDDSNFWEKSSFDSKTKIVLWINYQ